MVEFRIVHIKRYYLLTWGVTISEDTLLLNVAKPAKYRKSDFGFSLFIVKHVNDIHPETRTHYIRQATNLTESNKRPIQVG